LREKPIPADLISKWLEYAPLVTVNLVILERLSGKVLLVKRKNEPEAGKWFTPGGIIHNRELLTDQIYSILEEETGIEGYITALVCFTEEHHPSGYGAENIKLITIVFKIAATNEYMKTNDEHSDIRWFSITELPRDLNENVLRWIQLAQR